MNNHIRFLLLFAVICLSSSVTAQFKFSDKEVTKVVLLIMTGLIRIKIQFGCLPIPEMP